MINRPQICVSSATGHKPVFPLHNHSKVLIVQQQNFNRQALAMKSGQFLDVHLERAVSVDVDNQSVWMSCLNAHRSRQAEAHGSQTRTAQPAAGFVELVELSRPHLMLAHAHGDVSVSVASLAAQFVNRVLLLNGIACVVVSQRKLGLPTGNLMIPFRQVRNIFFGQRGIQSNQRLFHIRVNWDVSFFVLVNL